MLRFEERKLQWEQRSSCMDWERRTVELRSMPTSQNRDMGHPAGLAMTSRRRKASGLPLGARNQPGDSSVRPVRRVQSTADIHHCVSLAGRVHVSSRAILSSTSSSPLGTE